MCRRACMSKIKDYKHTINFFTFKITIKLIMFKGNENMVKLGIQLK